MAGARSTVDGGGGRRQPAGAPPRGRQPPGRPLDGIPEIIRQAVVAAEDNHFWSHGGYDVRAVGRAALANLQARRVAQGASTITQQLAKQNFVGDSPTVVRKGKELLHAVGLEQRYSKEELLERYLNQVYFGAGAYGVVAAAEEFFGAGVGELSPSQAALLAGLIRAPAALDPRAYPEAATARRNDVLRAMGTAGYLPPPAVAAGVAEPLKVMPARPPEMQGALRRRGREAGVPGQSRIRGHRRRAPAHAAHRRSPYRDDDPAPAAGGGESGHQVGAGGARLGAGRRRPPLGPGRRPSRRRGGGDRAVRRGHPGQPPAGQHIQTAGRRRGAGGGHAGVPAAGGRRAGAARLRRSTRAVAGRQLRRRRLRDHRPAGGGGRQREHRVRPARRRPGRGPDHQDGEPARRRCRPGPGPARVTGPVDRPGRADPWGLAARAGLRLRHLRRRRRPRQPVLHPAGPRPRTGRRSTGPGRRPSRCSTAR